MDWYTAQKLALALGLGLLVGFQREWTSPHVAGIRTITLITILGAVVGLFAFVLDVWIVVAGVIAITAMMISVNFLKFAGSDEQPGLTTQIAALIMYMVGVAIAMDQMAMGVIVAAGVAVLLQWKRPLHGIVERVGEQDVRAIFQLVLVSLVVLPVLPNQAYGPYLVLNPYEIWLMVVLICGISLGSYLAYNFLGPGAGTVLGGILGGLISSTATTVSYSRRSRKVPAAAGLACLVIMIASTIVFGRVIVEVAVVAPAILTELVPPLAVMMVVMMLISAVLYLCTNKAEYVPMEGDPSDLKAALVFGALYAAVLFAVAVAKQHFGDEGLYIVAAMSGLTDMDAITLSTAQLIKAERLSIDTGWRMIMIGAMSNLAFKTCAVAFLGSRALLWRIVLLFGISFAIGTLLLRYWQ